MKRFWLTLAGCMAALLAVDLVGYVIERAAVLRDDLDLGPDLVDEVEDLDEISRPPSVGQSTPVVAQRIGDGHAQALAIGMRCGVCQAESIRLYAIRSQTIQQPCPLCRNRGIPVQLEVPR